MVSSLTYTIFMGVFHDVLGKGLEDLEGRYKPWRADLFTTQLSTNSDAYTIPMKKILIFSLINLILAIALLAFDFPEQEKGELPQIAGQKIPFQKKRGLIFVKALLNGEKKNFILDTGAPSLILNSAYTEEGNLSDSLDAVGGSVSTRKVQVESFDWAGIRQINFETISMDLSHLERENEKIFCWIDWI